MNDCDQLREMTIEYRGKRFLVRSDGLVWDHRKQCWTPGTRKTSRYYTHRGESVHRLIASAFLPNPESKPVVDHINTDTSNNHVSNLRWSTVRENINNPISIEKMKASQPRNYGELNPFFGHKHNDESLSKMRGRVVSDETRQKMSENMKRRLGDKSKHPSFGKKRTEEQRARMKEAQRKIADKKRKE